LRWTRYTAFRSPVPAALCVAISAGPNIDMTEYELNTLIMLAAEKSGDVMEFWVSVSFAVVVASFFISKKMNVKIFKIMGFLYALSSLFLGSIYVGSALRANHYFDQLVNLGVDASHFSNPAGFTTIFMAPLLFFGGTGATLYYMSYCAKITIADDENT
jgi:hypothetical protein